MGAFLEFGVLGPLRTIGGEGTAITSPTQRRLLALLLCRPNQRAPIDTLMHALWPDQPDAAPRRLHLQVHRLRKTLGDPDRLRPAQGGYVLQVLPGELDAEQFEVDRQKALTADPQTARILLRDALALWRGEPYADVLDLPAVAVEAARLSELRASAIEALYTAELDNAAGFLPSVLTELGELARQNPFRERIQALLMVALARSGRQAEALEVYRSTRRHLLDELGIEAGPELRRVEAMILAGERPTVHEETAAEPTVRPAQLPPRGADLVGRDRELSQLDALLRGEASVLVISGTAGAGKTALAKHWAHQVRHSFPDGQLFFNLRGYGPGAPIPPDAALDSMLRSLGVPGPRIPEDLAARSSLFRSLLADRRVLLVLDDVRNPAQVRPLLPANGLVVVTSRNQLRGLVAVDGARRVTVGRLGRAEAVALMASTTPASEFLGEVAELCGRLPLALMIAAEYLARQPEHGARDLLGRLRSKRGVLDALAGPGDPATDLRLIFSSSYRALDAEAARLFRLLGVHPGPDIGLAAAGALTGVEAVRRSLDLLVDAHLVEQRGPSRFGLHDLLRVYAEELADAAGETDAALDRVFSWYLHSAADARRAMGRGVPLTDLGPVGEVTPQTFAEAAEATSWFEAEHQNLAAAVRDAAERGRHHAAYSITHMLWIHLSHRYLLDDVFEFQRIARGAAEAAGDHAGRATSESQLGTTFLRLGDHRRAQASFERAAEAFRSAGNARGEASALANLGAVFQTTGRYEKALVCQRQGVGIIGPSGHPDQRTHLLNNMAMTLTSLGRYDDAVRAGREALDLVSRHDIPSTRPHVWDTLGLALVGRGEATAAISAFDEALALFREVDDRWSEALILAHLGAAQRDAGRTDEARATVQQSLRILDRIGAADNDELSRADLVELLVSLQAPTRFRRVP